MGSAAPAVAAQTAREPEPQAPVGIVSQSSPNIDSVRSAVLNALASADQTMLCSMLEAGEWSIAGNELTIRLAASATLIEMSVSASAKKMIIASASGALGRAVKLQVLPGATAQIAPSRTQTSYSNGSSRSRAEREPVVQRLKEKFGAQIRTVIDYKGKK
jgi:hypothetical protein